MDEDPNQAAVREVKEEAGLDVILVGEVPIFESENNSYKEQQRSKENLLLS